MKNVVLAITTLFAFALCVTAVPINKRVNHWGSVRHNISIRALATYFGFEYKGTWFYPGLGACGEWDSASDFVVALATPRYGDGGNCNQVSLVGKNHRVNSLKLNLVAPYYEH